LIAAPSPRLEDDVVALRPWTEADLPAVEAAVADPEIARRNRLPQPFDPAEWFAEITRQQRAGEGLRLLIVDPVTDRLLGATALADFDREHRSADLGYWVLASERGRGIAPRAITLLTAWAFDALELDQIAAATDLDNAPSRRLLEKLGFDLVTEDADQAHYALRKQTFRNRQVDG
jgi:[ribosomal protein S5]-alanine N-acetyltransferase